MGNRCSFAYKYPHHNNHQSDQFSVTTWNERYNSPANLQVPRKKFPAGG